jgi:hypothetical protein
MKRTTVSLTSYGERLKEATPKAIRSLFSQDFTPDKVILYLAEKDRQNVENQFENLPVEIRIVPDVMSHKKFFALTEREFDNDFIVIVDDDLQYKPYFWGKLWAKYEEHKSEQNFIVCNRAQTVSNRKYKERKFVMKTDPDCGRFIFGSGAGLLIPPQTMRFNKETINESFALCPHCDETFFSAYCIKNDIKTFCTGKPQPFWVIPLPAKDAYGLWDKFNKFEKDETFRRAFEYFQIPIETPVVVSFTSWPKRINFAADVVRRMRAQTHRPTRIILTLAAEEFPNKENDLPKELTSKIAPDFEIRWTDKNTYTFKKLLPIIEAQNDDLFLIIDDDVIYPTNFIESMLDGVDMFRPVSGSRLRTNYRHFGNVVSANGAMTLIKPSHCMPELKQLAEKCLSETNDIASDPILTYSVFLHGLTFATSKRDFRQLQAQTDGKFPQPYSAGKSGRARSERTHEIILKYICN